MHACEIRRADEQGSGLATQHGFRRVDVLEGNSRFRVSGGLGSDPGGNTCGGGTTCP